MIKIFRAKYPQYDDMNEQEIMTALTAKGITLEDILKPEPEDEQQAAERWKTIGGDDEGTRITQTAEIGSSEGAEADATAEADQDGQEVKQGADKLRPVVIANGKKIVGKVGQTHDEVLQDHNKPTSIKTRGFATSNGRVLNRKMAMEWLKYNDPQTYKNLKSAGVKELHTEVYNLASGGDE